MDYSKQARSRLQESLATLDILEQTLNEKEKLNRPPSPGELQSRKTSNSESLEDLQRENERAVREMIRRLLSLPMNKRTNFLRVRVGPGGSAL